MISGVGLGVTLIPTLVYMAVAEQGIGPILSQEIFPEVPLYLLLAICGAPITISGLLIFRGGIKEMIRQAEMQARLRELEIAESGTYKVEEEVPRGTDSTQGVPDVSSVAKEMGSEQVGGASLIKVKTAGTTIICLSCGQSLPLGSTRCSKCGAVIEVASNPERTCPVCGGDLARAAKLGDNVYICGLCFSELEIPPDLASRIFK